MMPKPLTGLYAQIHKQSIEIAHRKLFEMKISQIRDEAIRRYSKNFDGHC